MKGLDGGGRPGVQSRVASRRLCAVSVDLDEIPNYFAIHGLPEPSGAERSLVYDVAIDRLLTLAREQAMPLTLFAIAADLKRSSAAEKLCVARGAGCEIGNHSLEHRYDLARLDPEEMRRQVKEGADVIEQAVGERPAGFRAPGYTVSDALLAAVAESGATYDSSVFPCPAYWALKTAAIASIALRGRRSRSVVDTPRVLSAPTRPYRVGRPYWRRGAGLLEMPVQVTPTLRLPFIGTSLTMGGPRFARWLTRDCLGEPLVNLELHGIDVLDATDGLHALAPHQPDVRVSTARKLDSLRAVFSELVSGGYEFVTLKSAAAQCGAM